MQLHHWSVLKLSCKTTNQITGFFLLQQAWSVLQLDFTPYFFIQCTFSWVPFYDKTKGSFSKPRAWIKIQNNCCWEKRNQTDYNSVQYVSSNWVFLKLNLQIFHEDASGFTKFSPLNESTMVWLTSGKICGGNSN